MCDFSDNIFLMSQRFVNCHVTGWKRYRLNMFVPNFIKYLTDIRAHFTTQNRIAKNKIMSL